MTERETKESYPIKTLCLLKKDHELLLAMKRRDWGTGRWNGPGGKPDEGESIEQAAIRETEEEVKVTPLSLRKTAHLYFTFDKKTGMESASSSF